MAAERPWREEADGVALRVRVTPKAGRDALAGVQMLSDGGLVLAVKVRAAPEDGAANEAARRCLAKALGRPASAVALRSGATARLKTLAVSGEPRPLIAALEALVGSIQAEERS
jgi:uncharacterized protein YggU (UPF0235/DUF167 family)